MLFRSADAAGAAGEGGGEAIEAPRLAARRRKGKACRRAAALSYGDAMIDEILQLLRITFRLHRDVIVGDGCQYFNVIIEFSGQLQIECGTNYRILIVAECDPPGDITISLQALHFERIIYTFLSGIAEWVVLSGICFFDYIAASVRPVAGKQQREYAV